MWNLWWTTNICLFRRFSCFAVIKPMLHTHSLIQHRCSINVAIDSVVKYTFNPLTPNDRYSGRTAPLTSKVAFYIFIKKIWIMNILNMVYTLRFSLQNAVCFIILMYLVSVLFTFYIQVC
jgi:hypothetical protein